MLTPRGQAELLLWEQSNNSWVVLWQVPLVKCDFYGYCGPFSSCDENGLHKFCRCLEGFEPKDQKEWELGNWTGGCTRRMALTCDIGDQFSKLERMKLPDYSISVGNMIAVSQCELECSKNCTCVAYAYTNVSSEAVSCMHWFGDLVDLKGNDINGKDLMSAFMTLIKVFGNGKLTHKSRSVIAIAAAAISTGLLLICSFGYALRRRMRSRGILHAFANGTLLVSHAWFCFTDYSEFREGRSKCT
ncbi:S-locus-specific glycoprotein S13 [Camellia lanceoleosa]|uniref:S-locus-specific glycoprotein S13 n=1 Tax=Camellia lanceoleosa TaxID=1840588 RepID=A0ACC0H4T9_9ERIC|nr:S-locus-specific glycoprotein S13 [Camellia lanceoleosa]